MEAEEQQENTLVWQTFVNNTILNTNKLINASPSQY
jgi:hypothetical protein